MSKIDIDKFIASLIAFADDNGEVVWVDYLCSSLQDQGLEYKDGEIEEYKPKDAYKQGYKDAINKACAYLLDKFKPSFNDYAEYLVAGFKEFMEEQ